jgi:hypothetical protein
MVILHAFLALAAGFITMAVLIAVIAALLRKYIPEWANVTTTPNPAYTFVNLGTSFIAGGVGGYVTARIAEHNPLFHVLALAIAVLLLAALSALQQRGKLPIWYLLALVAITPAGVFVGGLIRMRALGVL